MQWNEAEDVRRCRRCWKWAGEIVRRLCNETLCDYVIVAQVSVVRIISAMDGFITIRKQVKVKESCINKYLS